MTTPISSSVRAAPGTLFIQFVTRNKNRTLSTNKNLTTTSQPHLHQMFFVQNRSSKQRKRDQHSPSTTTKQETSTKRAQHRIFKDFEKLQTPPSLFREFEHITSICCEYSFQYSLIRLQIVRSVTRAQRAAFAAKWDEILALWSHPTSVVWRHRGVPI